MKGSEENKLYRDIAFSPLSNSNICRDKTRNQKNHFSNRMIEAKRESLTNFEIYQNPISIFMCCLDDPERIINVCVGE